MPIEPGATYVFDLDDYHYAWWAGLDAAGCRLVTRLKNNTLLAVTAEQALPDGSELVYDRIGRLPERLCLHPPEPLHRPGPRDRRQA